MTSIGSIGRVRNNLLHNRISKLNRRQFIEDFEEVREGMKEELGQQRTQKLFNFG